MLKIKASSEIEGALMEGFLDSQYLALSSIALSRISSSRIASLSRVSFLNQLENQLGGLLLVSSRCVSA